jgi:hypothetical protein
MIEIPTNIESLKDKIAYLRDQEPVVEMPTLPKHPQRYVFPRIPDLEAMTKYANNLLQYVAERQQYNEDYETAKKLYDEAKPQRLAIATQITELIKEDTGLTALPISEKKKQQIWDKAWEDVDYESEAIENLRELVELFED